MMDSDIPQAITIRYFSHFPWVAGISEIEAQLAAQGLALCKRPSP